MEVTGKIISTGPTFQLGGRFKKGDVLLTIDPADYEAAKAHADATLARAKLAHLEENARAEQARQEWEAAKGAGGDQEPSPLVLRQPQLELAEAELASAQQAADLARRNLERTRLRAPYDGVLTEKLADIGQVVAGGPAAPVARAYSTEVLEVRLPISSLEITFLELQTKPAAQLTANIGGREWTWGARIERDAGQVDRATRFHHLVARIDTSGGEPGRPGLLPGQFVTATIAGETLAGLFRVPRQAFVSEDELYLLTPQDTLLRRRVNILYRLPDALLVDEGLAPGDTLNLTRLQFMNDGLQVRRPARPAPAPPTASSCSSSRAVAGTPPRWTPSTRPTASAPSAAPTWTRTPSWAASATCRGPADPTARPWTASSCAGASAPPSCAASTCTPPVTRPA